MAETILSAKPFVIAFLGGVLPSLLWLWFWLREDKKNPEPKGLIALSFVAGMAVVYFVLPAQKLFVAILPGVMHGLDLISSSWAFVVPPEETIKTIGWAFTEEFGKFATVFLVAYHSRDFDEPMDCIMYMITAALGFAAMENTLYILRDIPTSGTADLIINGDLRFMGATIVHIASSAIIGLAFAFAFYGKHFFKVLAGFFGLTLATLLHAYFNLSIIDAREMLGTLIVFSKYWLAILAVIVLIEIVKHIKPPQTS